MGKQPSLTSRYAIAILATSAFMIWVAKDDTDRLLDVGIFWILAITAGWLQMLLISRGVRASFGAEAWPGWALLLAQTFIGAVPLTFEVRWLMLTIVNPEGGLPPPWMSYLNVIVINFVFSLVQYTLVERWPILAAARPDAEVRAEQEKIDASNAIPTIGQLKRRPDGLNGRIQYMQMEDHYLRVHTDEGAGLALYRMSDAVADLSDSDGMQVHRSWWVARDAVRDVRRERHKKTLIAHDGTEIPVGRSFEKALREEGWL
ncbi:LytTR family DNA-binding domain-containing protein [Tropicimonas marinistellae]|uniref:LytTR family DNA-binding domain-containing protein n=1 Tax=Tropicimonas marinistellae TaxID=1739787 RepID=UPI00082D173A|nr:LytTR family DNA-binding domain-containing protein [Tropicimonas marinistellae]